MNPPMARSGPPMALTGTPASPLLEYTGAPVTLKWQRIVLMWQRIKQSVLRKTRMVQLVLGLFAVRMQTLLGSQELISGLISHFRFAIT